MGVQEDGDWCPALVEALEASPDEALAHRGTVQANLVVLSNKVF